MMDIDSNRRHRRVSRRSFYGMIMTIAGLCVMIILLWHGLKHTIAGASEKDATPSAYTPDARSGVVYHKPSFSLSYVEEYELPEWVAYELTAGMLNKPGHKRDQDFDPDPAIATGSAHYSDYKGSGYRRGHLVPSADMAWDKASMDATFLLSNVAPMRAEFNDGIWLELEHHVRDWSRRYESIYVVAGPVFSNPMTTIGQNEVLAPRYFYKAVFTLKVHTPLVIGFMFDQSENAFGKLSDYIVPIDSIEKETGLDLFSNLYGDWDTEIALEKQETVHEGEWPFNPRWYAQRKKEGL